MIRFRPVAYAISLLLLALSVAMCVPAVADGFAGNPEWQAFMGCAVTTLAVGGMLLLGSRGGHVSMGIREAFLLTTGSWLMVTAFAALPFLFLKQNLDYADAFFETISGLTTTGSTVLSGLDAMPPGILLWRALLQWLGGIGIIAMAVAILPFLRVGGMQLFRTESSDRSEKVLPRPGQIAGAIGLIYLALTVFCAAGYNVTGMSTFDAVTHAMTTLSTGGYSTSDGSIGHFPAGSHWVAAVFMLSGGLPFVFYLKVLRGDRREALRDSQVRTFLMIITIVIGTLALWLVATRNEAPLSALRHATVNVVSIITTTGYVSTDYTAWGGLAIPVFFFLTFIGACTGSTAGGLKIFRFEILLLMARRQLQRLQFPHAVARDWYNGREIGEDVPISVLAFFGVYMGTFAVAALGLAAFGLDFVTAISGAITALANVGPGLGPVVGPRGNFSSLPDGAKWILSITMLMGRLEMFTVLVLLSPRFWR